MLLGKNSSIASFDFYRDWPVFHFPKDGIVAADSKSKVKTTFETKFPNCKKTLINYGYTKRDSKNRVVLNNISRYADVKATREFFAYNNKFKYGIIGDPMHLPEYTLDMYTFDFKGIDLKLSYTVNVNDDPFQDYIGIHGAYYIPILPMGYPSNKTFTVINNH
jgi:hypothetical protein